jgi:hypothetical protein
MIRHEGRQKKKDVYKVARFLKMGTMDFKVKYLKDEANRLLVRKEKFKTIRVYYFEWLLNHRNSNTMPELHDSFDISNMRLMWRIQELVVKNVLKG